MLQTLSATPPALPARHPGSLRDLLLTLLCVLSGPGMVGCAHLILKEGLGGMPRNFALFDPGTSSVGTLRPVEELFGLAAAGGGVILSLLTGCWLAAALLHSLLDRLLTGPRGATQAWVHRLRNRAARISPAFMRRTAAGALGASILALGTSAAAAAPGSDTAEGTFSGSLGTTSDAPLLPESSEPADIPAELIADRAERPTEVEVELDLIPEPQEDQMTPLFRPTAPKQTGRHAGAAVREEAEETRHVTVRSGDSLWGLVAEHLGAGATDWEVAREWPRWHRANEKTIGPDPKLLSPGTVLTIPQDR